MSKIETADFVLDADEPTYGMTVYEDGSGFCTRLVIEKPRNSGAFVGLVVHHGPAPEFSGKIPPLFIPSVEGELSVGAMMEESERHRQDLQWYLKAKAQLEASTLIPDIIKQEEEAYEWIHNRSSFGPLVSKERNGYSHETTVRDWFDTRAERTGKRQFKV